MVSKFNADGVEYRINEIMTSSGIEIYASVVSFREDLDIAHIRSEVLDMPVIEIVDNAAENHECLVEVYIPPSVTDVGKRAFANCISLKYFHLENKGEEVIIKDEAFCDCKNLITVFGNRLLYLMGERIFQGCSKMLSMPNLSGGIPNNSFNGCKKFQHVYLTDEIRFSYISELGLNKSGIKTITIFGETAFAEQAINHLVKRGIAVKASQLPLVADLAYSGVLVQKLGK